MTDAFCHHRTFRDVKCDVWVDNNNNNFKGSTHSCIPPPPKRSTNLFVFLQVTQSRKGLFTELALVRVAFELVLLLLAARFVVTVIELIAVLHFRGAVV